MIMKRTTLAIGVLLTSSLVACGLPPEEAESPSASTVQSALSGTMTFTLNLADVSNSGTSANVTVAYYDPNNQKNYQCTIWGPLSDRGTYSCSAAGTASASGSNYYATIYNPSNDGLGIGKFSVSDSTGTVWSVERFVGLGNIYPAKNYCSSCSWGFDEYSCARCWADGDGNGNCNKLKIGVGRYVSCVD